MRSRKEIKADFERTFPQRKDEQLNYQRQKLLLEAIQNMDEKFSMTLKSLAEAIEKFLEDTRKRL